MPLYEFCCQKCGPFTLQRAIADRDAQADCPRCASVAARVISAPNLALMPAARRVALTRNEKSRHEPGVLNRHHCHSRCGCGSTPVKVGAKPRRTADFGKLGKLDIPKKNKRPWMLGH